MQSQLSKPVIARVLHDARDTILYYANRYRFDPYMRQEHDEQLQRVEKLLDQVERELKINEFTHASRDS